MIICIPTTDNGGIEASISPHFGRTAWFTFVNAFTGEVECLRNDERNHIHGACVPTEEIVRRGVEGVLCRGIGRGASARLTAAGIPVYLTQERVTSSALEELSCGRATLLDGTGACSESHGGC